jgi:prolyl-tRNA editing enzyme YbaK/EbsC (Cys-tRNA(Pro) deacylase)
VLADRSLLAHEVVWVGAGSETHMAALAPADLLRLARARAVDLVAHG